MSPIEKAQVKADAISALGLHGAESLGEIRRAWKRKALETHPDQMGGDTEAFLRVKEAYEYLCTEDSILEAPPVVDNPTPVTPRRPGQAAKSSVKERTLSPEEQEACFTALTEQPESTAASHVAEVIQSQGRSLVYIVASQIAKGRNRVALPADILVTNRRTDPKIVSFDVPCMSAGDIVVPEEIRLELFPGARSVRIRFCPNLRRH